jgi:flagellar motor switch protein FliG
LNSIKEITEEAKNHPQKIARILSKWVSQSDDLARASSLFLRNCDIKTVELVCQAMHPSDLERVIGHVIEDFEPFGQENHRVIERMRADLAVAASEQLMRERPDPLDFIKRLSDDDIRDILEGESEGNIALIATQIPAHRLQKFYDTVNPETMKAILAGLARIEKASVLDFEPIQELLKNKMETIAGNLVLEKDRVLAIQQMVSVVASPVLQRDMMYGLQVDSPDLYSKVRPAVFVATDLRYLSSRVKNMLIQTVDADTLGSAVSGFDISFSLFLDGLPDAYQAVFKDAQSRNYDAILVNTAWKRVNSTISEMLTAGLIAKVEIANTIMRADAPIAKENGNDRGEAGLPDEPGASEGTDHSSDDDDEGNRGAA